MKKPGHAEGTLGVSCVRRNGGALSRRGPEETERNHGKKRSLGEGTLRVPCGSEEALCRNSRNVACDGWKKRLERGSPSVSLRFGPVSGKIVEVRETKGLRFLSAFLGTAW